MNNPSGYFFLFFIKVELIYYFGFIHYIRVIIKLIPKEEIGMFNVSEVSNGARIVAVVDGDFDMRKLSQKFIPNPKGKYVIMEFIDKPETLRDVLINLGITGSYSGADYIHDGVAMGMADESYIEMITKLMYPALAKRYNTTPSRIERTIRVAIEATWDKCDIDYRRRVFGVFGNPGMNRPSNTTYIKCIMRYLQ